MWGLSISHWIVLCGIGVLLFGRNIFTKFMTDVAGGIKNARKAFDELEHDR